jgi:Flp pilus assembly protein TadD
MASYDKAITLKPDNAEASNNRSVALIELGRLAEAQQAAEQAIQLAPRKARYYRTLGDINRYVAGDPGVTAMEELAQDAASLSVDDQIELHFALAKAYEDLDRHADAFRHWLDGNAIKRRQITYNEATALGALPSVSGRLAQRG